MPSPFTHAFAGLALGTVMVPGSPRWIAAGVALAILPDADFIGFKLGIPYASMLGHRGLSHSLLFAACVSTAVVLVARWRRRAAPAERAGRATPPLPRLLWPYLVLAALSHGLLDALTNGGLGIAFFAPFSAERHFFPWRPIVVAPLSVRRFFANRGVVVIASELAVVWIPGLALATVAWWVRRHRAART